MKDISSCIRYLLCALLMMAVSDAQYGIGETRSLKEFRVGAYDNPPKVYTGKSGEVVGIFPEILDIIAEREGWKLKYEQCSWQECLDLLESGELDIMVDIARSKERSAKFLFSEESVFLNWGTLYTRKGFTANNLIDLNRRTIAAVNGDIHTVGEEGIQRLASQFDLDVTFLYVDSYHKAMAMVEDGRADAAVVNRLFGVLAEHKYVVNKTPIVFNPVQLRFAFPKYEKYIAVAKTIDENVKQLKADTDSLFHKIINTYLAGVDFDFAFYKEMQPIRLTDDEQEWLSLHKVVRLGVDKGYAPYSFRNEDGSYQGIAVDIINTIARYLGIEIEIVDDLDWPQIMEYASQKKIDAILTSVPTPARQEFLNYTQTYLPTPLVIMTRNNNYEIEGPEDLSGKKVALVKGYFSANLVIQEHPNIIPLMVNTPLDGMTAVSTGEADCYIGGLGVCDYTARMHGIANLKVAGRYNMLLYGERIASRKDWPELARILDKALKAITEKKRLEIQQSWISTLATLEGPALLQQKNALTAEETAWVREHSEVLLGVDPEFAPFEFIDKKGQYKGIVSEYLDILEQRLGLTFTVVPSLTWQEAVTKARQGEIDMLPCIGKTADRQEFLLFSKPYMHYQRVIITRTDTPFISSIDDIQSMTVAVQKESSHEGYLLENTEVKPIPYPTLQKTLKAVSEGEVDAMVGNLSSSIYWIRKENYTNLKIAGPVSYASEELHFAVNKDLPQLVTIVEKGLASLSPFKQKNIREKWISVDYAPGLNPVDIFRYLALGLALVFLIIAFILLWNYRLKREISKHTGELKKNNQRLGKEIRSRAVAEAEREIMREQLSQAQKMEAIGTLAGGIAHDFNNILAAILGYAEMVQENCPTGSMMRNDIDRVVDAGNRAKELVKQILAFSRQAETEERTLQPALVIREVIKMLRASLPTTISIKQNIDPEAGLILADPTQIHQIVTNLCTNAFHAMEETGGTLDISLKNKELGLAELVGKPHLQPGTFVEISVRDTGPGIAPEIMNKIFDPFFTTKEIGKGTGMGLAIIHGIAKKSGGFVSCKSSQGEGTTFHVYLPVHTVTAPLEAETTSVELIQTGVEHILFIDDEEAITGLAKTMLERLGYKVTVEINSIEALKIIQDQPDRFDLVITDQTMPGMTGFDLARRILQIRPGLPIILCTGFSSQITEEKAKKYGIKGFAMKPLAKKDLAALVRKVLDGDKREG